MKGELTMDSGLSRADAVAIAIVLATVLVSTLCCAFLMGAGIVIAY
jgi:hypothetical protein